VNAPQSLIRITSLLLVASLLSGCASFSLFGSRVKPVEVQVKAVERTRLNIPHPGPLSAKPVEWILITPENAERVFAELKEKNVDLVLFGLTDDGYESLSVIMAELRNYIATQRQIIIKYQEYYEPEKSEEKK
jgi:hypothetical protein